MVPKGGDFSVVHMFFKPQRKFSIYVYLIQKRFKSNRIRVRFRVKVRVGVGVIELR